MRFFFNFHLLFWQYVFRQFHHSRVCLVILGSLGWLFQLTDVGDYSDYKSAGGGSNQQGSQGLGEALEGNLCWVGVCAAPRARAQPWDYLTCSGIQFSGFELVNGLHSRFGDSSGFDQSVDLGTANSSASPGSCPHPLTAFVTWSWNRKPQRPELCQCPQETKKARTVSVSRGWVLG